MQDILKNIEKAKQAAVKGAERGVDRARLAVETTAKKLIMRGPKTGWMYHRIPGEKWMVIWQDREGQSNIVAIFKADGAQNLSRDHRASKAGEPPATDTGTLASSIESKRDGLVAVVWTEKKYAKWLEFGTKKIEARPFMTPAVEQNKEKYPKELGAAVITKIEEALKK
jgi:HK97 gp10 family phage protein